MTFLEYIKTPEPKRFLRDIFFVVIISIWLLFCVVVPIWLPKFWGITLHGETRYLSWLVYWFAAFIINVIIYVFFDWLFFIKNEPEPPTR